MSIIFKKKTGLNDRWGCAQRKYWGFITKDDNGFVFKEIEHHHNC